MRSKDVMVIGDGYRGTGCQGYALSAFHSSPLSCVCREHTEAQGRVAIYFTTIINFLRTLEVLSEGILTKHRKDARSISSSAQIVKTVFPALSAAKVEKANKMFSRIMVHSPPCSPGSRLPGCWFRAQCRQQLKRACDFMFGGIDVHADFVLPFRHVSSHLKRLLICPFLLVTRRIFFSPSHFCYHFLHFFLAFSSNYSPTSPLPCRLFVLRFCV